MSEDTQKTGNIEDRVTKIIRENIDVEEDKITPEAHFMQDLGCDSLDTVELVMAFEDEFDMEIPDAEAEKMRQVQDVVSYVKERLNS